MKKRRIVLSLLLVFPLSGLTPLLAAANLRGQVHAEALPVDSVVQATPVADGSVAGLARFARIAEDGRFDFAELPQGAYLLAVVAPDGTAIPSPDGEIQLADLPAEGVVVADLSVGGPSAADETDTGATTEKKKKKSGVAGWQIGTAIGIVLAALAIGAATGRDSSSEDCIPSFSPMNPCP